MKKNDASIIRWIFWATVLNDWAIAWKFASLGSGSLQYLTTNISQGRCSDAFGVWRNIYYFLARNLLLSLSVKEQFSKSVSIRQNQRQKYRRRLFRTRCTRLPANGVINRVSRSQVGAVLRSFLSLGYWWKAITERFQRVQLQRAQLMEHGTVRWNFVEFLVGLSLPITARFYNAGISRFASYPAINLRFWRMFICDVFADRLQNGSPNPDRCLSVCLVCDVGVLWPNGWMD